MLVMPFITGGQHAVNMFVLQAVDVFECGYRQNEAK